LVALEDNLHYFPPYDAVPIVRSDALQRVPRLRGCLADLAGKVSAADMRHMNMEVDAQQRDVTAVVREFRAAKNL
jgi:osmoprotectant transport system substrate-binding protein